MKHPAIQHQADNEKRTLRTESLEFLVPVLSVLGRASREGKEAATAEERKKRINRWQAPLPVPFSCLRDKIHGFKIEETVISPYKSIRGCAPEVCKNPEIFQGARHP